MVYQCFEQVQYTVFMDRLAPDDVQAVVSGMASNRQLIVGIIEQLKEALQLPPKTLPQGLMFLSLCWETANYDKWNISVRRKQCICVLSWMPHLRGPSFLIFLCL